MVKGYWVTTGTIHTPLGMVPYLSALTDGLPTVDGWFLIRDISTDMREDNPGSVTIIIEFPSLAPAVSAYDTERYQKMIELRTNRSDLTLSISEELDA